MRKTIVKFFDPLLAILAFVLLFLVKKELMSTFIYVFIAGAIALYFFPVKLFIINKNLDANVPPSRIISLLIVAALIDLSIVYLYVNSGSFLSIMFSIISLINIGLAFFYLIKKNTTYSILHFSFCFLVAGALYV